MAIRTVRPFGESGRSGGGRTPPRTPPKPPKRPPQRPQTMEDWAKAQAEKRVAAEVAAIQAQQKIWEEEMAAAHRRRLEQAQQLATLIQGMGFDSRIRDIYSKSGADLAGLASGFAGQTRDIAAADAAAQMNMLSGTGQEGAVRDQGVNMGDVLYGVGGWIPGRALGEQGAAYAADAALQPAFALQQGAVEAGRAWDEGQDQRLEFAKAIAEAKAGKFGYTQELLDDRRKASLEQQKLRLDQLEADRDYWLKLQAFYISQKKFGLAKQAENRARMSENRYRMEAAGLTPTGEVAPGFHRDPKTGRIVENGYRADGSKIPTPGSGGKKGGGLTANQRSEILSKVTSPDTEKAMRDSLAGIIKEVNAQAQKMFDRTGKGPNNKRWMAMVRKRMLARWLPLAQNVPTAKRQLRAIIDRLVREALRGTTSSGGLTEGLTD